jgi:DNA-binding protein H-NS
MKHADLKSMSVDELWALHELLRSALTQRLLAEKSRLEQRLHELGCDTVDLAKKVSHARSPYPQVLPKYKNPAQPSETWAGRGKQPLWLKAQLKAGKSIDDFRIRSAARGSRQPSRKRK